MKHKQNTWRTRRYAEQHVYMSWQRKIVMVRHRTEHISKRRDNAPKILSHGSGPLAQIVDVEPATTDEEALPPAYSECGSRHVCINCIKSKELAVRNGWPDLGNPHLLECGQRRQDGSTIPHGIPALGRRQHGRTLHNSYFNSYTRPSDPQTFIQFLTPAHH